MSASFNRVVKLFHRGFRTSTVLEQPRSLIKLRKLQADFQYTTGSPKFILNLKCEKARKLSWWWYDVPGKFNLTKCEDGRPIWLKGGFSDRILYSSTIIGCYIGVIMTLAVIYDNAKPPSWKTPTC